MANKNTDVQEPQGCNCAECGKNFKTKHQLLIHSYEHTGELPFKCDICNKGFRRAVHLRDHMTIHNDSKQHTCADCGKSFTVLSSLKVHLLTHSGEKPHMCSECGRCFTRSSDMYKHRRIHSSDKPHICPDCGKTFSRNSHLNAHIDTRHRNLRNHICDKCNKGFYLARQLKNHMMSKHGNSHNVEKLPKKVEHISVNGNAINSTGQESKDETVINKNVEMKCDNIDLKLCNSEAENLISIIKVDTNIVKLNEITSLSNQNNLVTKITSIPKHDEDQFSNSSSNINGNEILSNDKIDTYEEDCEYRTFLNDFKSLVDDNICSNIS